jgi:hypothetical protein
MANNFALAQPQPAESYVQYLVQLHNKLEFAATKARLAVASPSFEGRLAHDFRCAGCKHHGAAGR